MEIKEFKFKGVRISGVFMLICVLLGFAAAAVSFFFCTDGAHFFVRPFAIGVILLILSIIFSCGFIAIEPGAARVMMFFSKYRGTYAEAGYHWVNPFIVAKRVSLRARNLDAEPIKVNDKMGNPIMIGLVLVWRLKDTYRAMFDIDAQTIARVSASDGKSSTAILMRAFEKFVKVQADAALRQVAGQYAYDNDTTHAGALTLRDGSEEINKELEAKIDERLVMAGIEVIEARINYLAYAPEIAAVMLRRQQADAIIAAREKIVDGAVSMVKMALDKLAEKDVVKLSDEKKAAMVSNLLVILCSDDNAQPVVNTGAKE